MDNDEVFGVPGAEIPDLKKKEKERKKAGFAWSGAKPGGSSFSGAAGGTAARAAASAAIGSGQIAAAGTFGFSSFLSGLLGTTLGRLMLAGAVAAFLAGGGLVGYSLLRGGGAAGAMGGGDLGVLSSSVKVRSASGDRTGYLASKGEITFDPVEAAAAKKEEPPSPAADAAAPGEAGDGEKPDWRQAGLAHDLSGAKLSSSLGGEFGGKNIFAGAGAGGVAPKLNANLSKVNIPAGQNGKLGPMRASSRTGRISQGIAGPRPRSNKAFGQLKVAKGLSTSGAGAAIQEGARSTAGAAFDGQTGTGNIERAGSGVVTSPSADGGSAPDVTAPGVTPPVGVPLDPHMPALNGISALAQQAGSLKKNGMMLLLLGLALTATMFLAPIGLILVGMGIAMMQMSSKMKNMADTMSQTLAARTGNINQNAINRYCIDRAYYQGTPTQNCDPPDSVTRGQSFDAESGKDIGQHKEMVKVNSQVVP
ncbi:MAG: hypothetical protein AAB036_08380 [Elusimicrobiota bacterium]